MGGGGKEIKGAAAEGCKSAPGKSRGAAGRDGSGKPGSGKPGCGGGERCGSALAALLSALAAASCVYLGVRTSDLQARVAAIEGARGGFSAAAPLPPLPGFSLEQLNAMMQEKVERLLAQKSYEHLAKIRVAREAPPECNCPPGSCAMMSCSGSGPQSLLRQSDDVGRRRSQVY
ncbi:collagen alpha-1(XXV) chain-like [Rissa tridactyla]|uniref:collagen alpha-1(XXV) chain-like n=1 Tax=Rissa tridactyla TaxID=75485 RepID=UPI0023BA5FB0|nr:collagen alpha-1(XXV) chain-like [Rissa tridactyla]